MSTLASILNTPQAQSIEARIHAAEFISIIKSLMAAGGDLGLAAERAMQQRAPEKVQTVLKAAVAAGSMSSLSSLADYQTAVSAFLATMKGHSVFDTLLPVSLQLPLRVRIAVVTSAITATQLGELSAKPISRLSLQGKTLEPIKAAAEVIISKELARFGGPIASNMIAAQLRNALAVVTDSAFFSLILTGVSAVPSAGNDARAVRSDLSTALDALSTGADSKIYFIVNSATAKRLSLMGDASGGSAFPAMSPTGGAIGNVPTLVSDGLPSNSLVALDAVQIATGDGGLEPKVGMHATVQLSDAPDSPPVSSSGVTSLWQHDLIATRLERFFGAERLRDQRARSAASTIPATARHKSEAHMDERDEQLKFLQRHASNFPSTERAEMRAPSNANHDLVRAITRGIGGPIKDELDKLRRENETLRAEVAALRAERAGDLAQLRLDIAQHHAKFVEVLERHGLPTDALTAPVRRLS